VSQASVAAPEAAAQAAAQQRRLRLPTRDGGSRRLPLLVRFAALILAAGAVCGLVAGLALVIRGLDPIAADATPDWYRDTLGSLGLAAALGIAASFTHGLRRWGIPIVVSLCLISIGVAAVVLLWRSFDAVLVSGIPAIVAAVVTLLILVLPPIRHRLED